MHAFDNPSGLSQKRFVNAADLSTEAWAILASSPQSHLTSKDYTLLEGHLARLGEEGPQPLLSRLMRTKLSRARVVLTNDVDADVATGSSRIVFSADGGPDQSRILVHWDNNRVLGECLRVATLLGTTVLGMRAGQAAPLLRADGTLGWLVLKDVVFQPEAARRLASKRRL
jgi:regulator of nucleoside diphosphate kinase